LAARPASVPELGGRIVSPHGQAWLLALGARDQLAFRCVVPIWSTDAASWLIEVFIEALRETGETGAVAISVAESF
jgi:hypothetical protein